MTTERLNPLNDLLFLKVMGEKGSEIQLLGFLNAVLGCTGTNRLLTRDRGSGTGDWGNKVICHGMIELVCHSMTDQSIYDLH